MHKEDLGRWIYSVRIFERIIYTYRHIEQGNLDGSIDFNSMWAGTVTIFKKDGFVATADRIKRGLQNWVDGYPSLSVASDLEEILNLMEFEGKSMVSLKLATGQSEWYNKTSKEFFGDRACQRFPSYIFEMEEALKCYALERSTACVFHCMRILESASGAVVKSLPRHTLLASGTPGWGQNRREIDLYLSKPTIWSKGFTKREPFYNEIRADLNAGHKAWRCDTGS